MSEAEVGPHTETTPQTNHIELAADIVSAYLSNNHVAAGDLPALIASVHAAVTGLGQAPATSEPEIKATPAQIRKSISHDALISFEDGKPYKTLRRHLTIRGLSPEAYRAKHGLPSDYPMVAASYSEQRSSLARSLGLGQQRRKPATKAGAAPEKVSEAVAAPKGRGGRKKAADAPVAAETPRKRAARRKAAEPALAE
ncbi:MucR family transcriptional regulator [Methylobacterium planeticum]|uniref:MucR family transcriptional regulator n=1 Tax=Methylobacterium planeticum TaxID=2615211 RepID=A0A6N6MRM1_9HYPH|nr:MucR family transcriptional regulator [Methylobacterium planeticum]KAB1073436.1 MucR family transcriptional regulator [Methylobacterium planeticum]